MEYPLNIAIVWHMHQPYYKNLKTNKYIMPWVRLHGIKDYYDMPAILENFPEIHQTFNLVPSLMEQIDDYVNNEANEECLELTLKPAGDLTMQDRIFILKNFFMANWDKMIKKVPNYFELLKKRGLFFSDASLVDVQRYFSVGEMRDIQVLFNLVWIDPMFVEEDAFLQDMLQKGKNYTEEEKHRIIDIQLDILKKIVPKHQELMQKGIIDVSITPFYHPILPLLCDTDIAKTAVPNIALPKKRFLHEEDARKQIKMAVDYYKQKFGCAPKGMWPSEGSVSEAIIPMIAEHGINWIATDEEILGKTLNRELGRDSYGNSNHPEVLYKPYIINKGDHKLNILFRDHTLSDLIGFVYSKWEHKAAAHNFIEKLHSIRKSLGALNQKGEFVVPIILDGENAWEYYDNDGRDFLLYLYDLVSKDKLLNFVTVSEALEKSPPKTNLNNLFPGSWINHNFRIWIGHEEDNKAWDLLSEARRALKEYETSVREPDKKTKEDIEMAWKEIYIAEGSDWCWWYGDDHSSENDAAFDQLFREHLKNVYLFIGMQPPEILNLSIISEEKAFHPTHEFVAFINPIIDGDVTNYFEWLPAANYDVKSMGGTMHQAEAVISNIYYGFNLENMFLRIDTSSKLREEIVNNMSFSLEFFAPIRGRADITFSNKKKVSAKFYVKDNDSKEWRLSEELKEVAADKIIELKIPFKALQAKTDDQIHFVVKVNKGDFEIERKPDSGYFSFSVPNEHYEEMMWQV
ncbi:alpha-amylase/alpha-mannosidase [Thermodesulfobacteriota bacterium]